MGNYHSLSSSSFAEQETKVATKLPIESQWTKWGKQSNCLADSPRGKGRGWSIPCPSNFVQQKQTKIKTTKKYKKLNSCFFV